MIFIAAPTVTVPPVPVAIVDNNVAATLSPTPSLTLTAPDKAAANGPVTVPVNAAANTAAVPVNV